MAVNLKPVHEQTIVLTGATSGIGLVTARNAAERGARLVLAARSEDSLQQLTQEITDGGGSAVYVVADVGNRGDVQTIARTATDRFGGCDTWINDAGVSIYGEIETTPVEEMRRLFDTNFWGVVYGSLEAVTLMRERGGALINIGSVLSERSALLQGAYSAAPSTHPIHAMPRTTWTPRRSCHLPSTPRTSWRRRSCTAPSTRAGL